MEGHFSEETDLDLKIKTEILDDDDYYSQDSQYPHVASIDSNRHIEDGGKLFDGDVSVKEENENPDLTAVKLELIVDSYEYDTMDTDLVPNASVEGGEIYTVGQQPEQGTAALEEGETGTASNQDITDICDEWTVKTESEESSSNEAEEYSGVADEGQIKEERLEDGEDSGKEVEQSHEFEEKSSLEDPDSGEFAQAVFPPDFEQDTNSLTNMSDTKPVPVSITEVATAHETELLGSDEEFPLYFDVADDEHFPTRKKKKRSSPKVKTVKGEENNTKANAETNAESKPKRKMASPKQRKKATSPKPKPNKRPDIHSSLICSACGQSFSYAGNLRRHMLTHAEKEHACPQCEKRFACPNQLKRHMISHASDRPFQCSQCSKSFRYSQHLKEHMRIHTGERPHMCHLCPKTFTQSSSLRKHLAVHSGAKDYKCQICFKAFTESSHLTRHQKVHIGSKLRTFGEQKNVYDREPEGVIDEEKEEFQTFSHDGKVQYMLPTTSMKSSLTEDIPRQTHYVNSQYGIPNSSTMETSDQQEHGYVPPLTRQRKYKPEAPTDFNKGVASDGEEDDFFSTDVPSADESDEEYQPTDQLENSEDSLSSAETVIGSGSVNCKSLSKACATSPNTGIKKNMNNITLEVEDKFSSGPVQSQEDVDEIAPVNEMSTIQVFPCSHCDRKFMTEAKLQRHLKTHGRADEAWNKFECMVCHRTFKFSHHLREHVRSHTGEKPYKCLFCPKAFSQAGSLRKHNTVHSGEKKHQCKVCSKSFSDSSNLIRHEKLHSGEKRHHCPYCDKSFTEAFNMRHHVRTHTEEKPHICDVCGSAFRIMARLKEHRAIHSEERSFKCQECEAAFKTPRGLYRHQMTHREKQHMCRECGQCFTQRSQLTTHMRIHTGERPFECVQCGKKFRRSSALCRHLRIHSGYRPYECKHCDKAYAEYTGLKKHMLNHHANMMDGSE